MPEGLPCNDTKGIFMRLRTLGWSGVEIEHDGQTLLIDYIEDTSMLNTHEALPSPSRPGAAAVALVTHLHPDHADPVALASALAEGASVLRPEPNPGSHPLSADAQSAPLYRGVQCAGALYRQGSGTGREDFPPHPGRMVYAMRRGERPLQATATRFATCRLGLSDR